MNKDLENQAKRDKLSDYLPYLAYDKDSSEFINRDNTFGIAYECSPLYFASENSVNILSSIIAQDYGKDSILQFILYADTNIDNHCNAIKSADNIQTDLSTKMHKYHIDFLKNLENYHIKTKGNKLKNYRLFVCLKSKDNFTQTTKSAFKESLTGLGFYPRNIDAKLMLSITRQLLGGASSNQDNYNQDELLSKQIITADNDIDFSHKDYLKVANEYVGVVTPKEFPDAQDKKGLSTLDVNELIGGYGGGMGDLDQINERFILSCNIVLSSVNTELMTKSQLANAQRAGAKLSNNITDRITALSLAYKNSESDSYFKFIPSIVIFAENQTSLSTNLTKVKRIWQKKGFIMQTENYIKQIMFLQSLPFGLYAGKKNSNISTLDRHFIASSKAIANQLPIQADYCGYGSPVVPMIGRKGQVQGLDIFSKRSNNHNFLTCATSGSGKSFFVNWLVSNYLANGVKIRINDIGGSYKKLCKLFDGEYIDIEDKNVNLNPFQGISNIENIDDEDKKHDIETIVMIVGEMIYANSENGELTSEEIGLLTHAVKEAIARGVVENSIDFIQNYLSNLKDFGNSGQIPASLHQRGKELSFNLCEFSSKGEYGRLFNGVSKNNWQDNPFVVLELESLSEKPALMKVVSLQIINMMTAEMYQGDRSIKKMSIFDEVAFVLGSSQRLAKVIEDGYRRARKYNGSFGTIFQSILDTQLFGRLGKVMNNNAAFKFFLESDDYQTAIDEGILNLNEFEAKLLTGVKSNKPHYSELFMNTPGGVGVSRLMVGPFGYAVATTDADDVAEIDNYQKDGLSITTSLERFAIKRGLKL